MSDRAENLEAIELRLKNDILVEAHKYGGLILTHNEVGECPIIRSRSGFRAHLTGVSQPPNPAMGPSSPLGPLSMRATCGRPVS